MRYRKGLTLIEMLVVVVVLAAIASIALSSYINQQKINRDDKRRADIVALAQAMENYFNKTGNYPLTCNFSTGAISSCTASIVTSSYSQTMSPIINGSTTKSQLRNILPELEETFGNPTQKAGNPINRYVSNDITMDTYFLLSTDMVATTSTPPVGAIGFQLPNGGRFTCAYVPANQTSNGTSGYRPHRFIVGFYSEVDNAWKFYRNLDRPNELNSLSFGGDARCNTGQIDELRQPKTF